LVELLVTIAVIAVVAAIAIPNISSISQSAEEAKVQRNAQAIASTYSAAVAAGLATNGIASLSNAIAIMAAGTNVPTGNTSQFFRVDGLTEPEITKAADRYLRFTNGMIHYGSNP